jgi:CheY-like chemotaxis protein
MSSTPSFSVCVVGLDAQHLRLIEVVFRHIQHNRYAFRLAAPLEEAAADVLIAGVGDPTGREALARARARGHPAAAIAVIGPDGSGGGRHAIETAQLVRQLLPILNRVVEIEGLAGGPHRPSGANAPASADRTVGAGAPRGAPPHVLLIDRDEQVRARVAGALDRLDIELDVVASAADARECLVLRRADLVLFDPALADGQGLKWIRSIRREPAWRDLPIVVLSERPSPLDVVRSAFVGCSACLAKPFDDEVLCRTVTRLLGRSRGESLPEARLRLVDAHAAAS